jgi:hypothetical protein
MNKQLVFILILFSAAGVQAQTVTVTKQNEKIKEESIEVFAVTLEGKKEDISLAWNKFLKEIGKLKQSTVPMTVSEPMFNGTIFQANSFYAQLKKSTETSSTVWAGIIPAEWNQSDVDRINRELEKSVHQFGVTYYRSKVQEKIDETQQALDAVEKQQQRTLNQNKDLTLKLSNSDQEKIRLEKSLEANKLENAVLKIKIQNNKKAQDSLANVGTQIKKVMETHKEKQRKIN